LRHNKNVPSAMHLAAIVICQDVRAEFYLNAAVCRSKQRRFIQGLVHSGKNYFELIDWMVRPNGRKFNTI